MILQNWSMRRFVIYFEEFDIALLSRAFFIYLHFTDQTDAITKTISAITASIDYEQNKVQTTNVLTAGDLIKIDGVIKTVSIASLMRILRNVSYTGTFVTGKRRNNRTDRLKPVPIPPEKWFYHHNHHMPIIDDITFYSVQRILSERCSLISGEKTVHDFF